MISKTRQGGEDGWWRRGLVIERAREERKRQWENGEEVDLQKLVEFFFFFCSFLNFALQPFERLALRQRPLSGDSFYFLCSLLDHTLVTRPSLPCLAKRKERVQLAERTSIGVQTFKKSQNQISKDIPSGGNTDRERTVLDMETDHFLPQALSRLDTSLRSKRAEFVSQQH